MLSLHLVTFITFGDDISITSVEKPPFSSVVINGPIVELFYVDIRHLESTRVRLFQRNDRVSKAPVSS